MAADVAITLGIEGRRDVERELGKVDKAVDQVGKALDELDTDADQAGRALRELGRDGDRSLRGLASDVDRATDRVSDDLKGLGRDSEQAGRRFRDFATGAQRHAQQLGDVLDSIDLDGAGAVGATNALSGGLIGAALTPLGLVAEREGLSSVVSDVLFGLTDRALEQATAVRLGTDSTTAGDLIREIGESFPTLEASDIAEALIAADENAPLANPRGIVNRVGTLARLEQAGLGDSSELALAAANAAANLDGDFDTAISAIVTAFQQGGNRQGDLLDTLTEYSNNAAAIGLDLEDLAGILTAGSAPELGLFNLDKVGDAIREIGNQIRDGGDEVDAALTALGLERDAVRESFASGTGRDDFVQIVSGLTELVGTAQGDRLALDLFRTPFEDLSAQLLEVLDLEANRLEVAQDAAEVAAGQIRGGFLTALLGPTVRDASSGFFSPTEGLPFDPLNTAGRPQGAPNPRIGTAPAALQAFGEEPQVRLAPDVEASLLNYLNQQPVNITIEAPTLQTGVVTSAGDVQTFLQRYAQSIADVVTPAIDRRIQRVRVFSASGQRIGGGL